MLNKYRLHETNVDLAVSAVKASFTRSRFELRAQFTLPIYKSTLSVGIYCSNLSVEIPGSRVAVGKGWCSIERARSARLLQSAPTVQPPPRTRYPPDVPPTQIFGKHSAD